MSVASSDRHRSRSRSTLAWAHSYVISRSLWDPTEDSEAAIRRFTDGYFGSGAAPFVRDYMDAMCEGIEKTAYYMHESFDEHAAFLQPALLLRSAQAFGSAASAASGRFIGRVSAAAMPLMYVVLFRWDELRAYASNASVSWPYNESKRDQFAEFARRYALLKVSKLNEGGDNISWMEQSLFPSTMGGQGRRVGGDARWRSRLHWKL